MRYLAFSGIAVAFLLAFSSFVGSSRGEGVQLSPTDYVYLLTQGVPRDSPILQRMSPKELYRLHQLINDEKMQSKPESKTDAVKGALAEFEGNQHWEKANPGQLWNAEKRRDPRKSKGN